MRRISTEDQKIIINFEECIGCKKCVEICPANVYEMNEKKPKIINEGACTLCGVCVDQCPKNAIIITIQVDTKRFQTDYQVKKEQAELAFSLISILDLKKSPVAIKLVNDEKVIPQEIRNMNIPIRHCVSINTAAHGAVFYLPKEKHACSAAKAALGMAPLPEKVKNGQIPYMHGLAATQKAAARIMAEIPKLSLNFTIGTLVGPLENAPFDPDIVILTVNPKQAMWVANSLLFKTGSPRRTANFAGMQASCADATTIPILTNEVNFTLGCYGCRSAGKLGDDEMYVGIPIDQLEKVVLGLKGLKKAMKSLGGRKR